MIIELTNGGCAIIDDEDDSLIGQYNWHKGPKGCARAWINGTTIDMHRLLLKPRTDQKVKHLNGNRCDNRRCNLLLGDPWIMPKVGDTIGLLEILEFQRLPDRTALFAKTKCMNCQLVLSKPVHAIIRRSGACKCHGRKTGHGSLRKLYSNYKLAAIKKGREFELSLEQFHDITYRPCHYCGQEPHGLCVDAHCLRKNWYGYKFNGIDRKNNRLGYTLTNSLPCCKICNRAKGTMVYEDFLQHLQRVAKHQAVLQSSE